MRYQPLSQELYIRNRSKLRQLMKPNSMAIINSNDEMPRSGDQTFGFRQNSDLFYLSGLDQEKCVLTLCPDHPVEALREVVFTVRTNDLMVTWNGYKYTLDEARSLSGVKTIKWLDDFELTLRDQMSRVQTVYLNQNEYVKFVTEVPSRDLRFAEKMKRDFPVHTYERLAPLITQLRRVKEPEETAQMQRACDLTRDGFLRVLDFVKPGIAEYEVEAAFSHEFARKGGGHAYQPIVASGRNACVLHYVSNDQVMKDGDLLLLDVGAEYGNYCADMSRTIPVNGKFTQRQRRVYEAVLRLLKAGMELLVPGKTNEQWHAEVCKLMERELLGLGLITRQQIEMQDPSSPAYFRYYMHGTGHFLGLDVHDVGSRQDVFEKGMVMTCEPGIYIPEEGIGIRLENDVVVDNPPRNLMAHIPVEPDEIEALMAKRG